MTRSPLQAALLSLEGLSLGDAFGQYVFRQAPSPKVVLHNRKLPPGPWRYSDDTVMALALYQHLKDKGQVEQDELARLFGASYQAEPERGYGAFACWLLPQLSEGGDFRVLSRQIYDGQGSMGNGAAMRVAPLGAYFAYDVKALVSNALASAEVTHAHPEGQAGALAVALAAAYAHQTSSPSAKEMLSFVAAKTPPGETQRGLREALTLLGASPEQAAKRLGDGERVIAPDTVPFALWCAARFAKSYQNALWAAAEGTQQPKADRDTICAIVGGIVALSAKEESLPTRWREAREPLRL